MTDPTEALARVLSDVYYADALSGIDHDAAQRILTDPGPLLAALAAAGVLTEVTAPLKRNCRGGWAAVYDGNHTTEGRRYVTEWRPTDA